jgi:hypothetical protein
MKSSMRMQLWQEALKPGENLLIEYLDLCHLIP